MAPKRKYIYFFLLTVVFSEEKHFWDLGVKIQDVEKQTLLKTENIKNQNDKKLFDEIVGLSNKLKISQKIIDQENTILNKKIMKERQKASLVFKNEKEKNKHEKKEQEKLSRINAYQNGRYRDAIKYLDQLNSSNTTKIEKNKINYLKANAYFNLGEYEKSKEYLASLLLEEQSKLLDDALLLKGIICKQQGKEEEALSFFSQIILEHPNSEFYESAQIQKRILSNKKNDKK